jgi:hypothetical protein
MTDEKILAEAVAKRMEGLKQFTVHAREMGYYSKTVWAKDAEEAEEIANDTYDWGEAIDYSDFVIYEIEEEVCTGTTE